MPTPVRATRRRVARPRPRRPTQRRRVGDAARPAPRPAAGRDEALPAALLPELAVVLADVAWALVRKGGGDDAAGGEP